MTEQIPAPRRVVPSNGSAQSRNRRISIPTHGSYSPPAPLQQYNTQAHQQSPQYLNQQHQHQYQQHPPRQYQQQQVHHSRRMSNQAFSALPLTMPQAVHEHAATNAQPSVQTPNPQGAHPPSSVPPEDVLRERVVSLLASTANGCIVELGYPSLLDNYQTLSARYNELGEDYRALKAEDSKIRDENIRLTNVLIALQADLQRKDEQYVQRIQSLNARIAQLEKEKDLYSRQFRVLQQARTLDAPQAYKILEDKYHYVLNLLKRYRIPITIQNPNGSGEIDVTSAKVTNNSIPNNAEVDKIDLPASPKNPSTVESRRQPTLPLGTNTIMELDTSQFVQGSSTGQSLNTSGSPSDATQRESPVNALDPKKHVRLASAPPLDHLDLSTPPSEQVIQTPVSLPTRSVADRPTNTDQQHIMTVNGATTGEQGAATDVAMPLYHNVSSPQVPVGSTGRFGLTTHSQQVLAAPGQAQLIIPSNYATSHVPAVNGEGRPQLHIQTTFERGERQTPVRILSPVSQQIVEAAGLTTEPMRATSPVATTSATKDRRETLQESTSRSRDQTPNSAPSPPIVVTPKDTQLMEGDRDTGQRGMEVEDQDVVMAEERAPLSGVKEVPASEAPGKDETPVQAVEGEDEDEEAYDDLTDDEDGRKQPVIDCIVSIFYDDENDERFCTFCNARLENNKSSDRRPTFTEYSIRELIMHGKKEHTPVWEKLRRPRTNPT